ncbi:MAG: hypothetical protein KF799_05365 [Bdellovibrionales bacterium]|nr:hypothetical protein [Bdellovibrionales bacterium]
MNIKGLNNFTPVSGLDSKQRVEGARTQNTGDRDGNGRREQAEPELKRHLGQQEFDDCIKALGEMPGLKANNLSIKVEVESDVRIVLIIDPTGKIVRRLSEAQLWSATRDKDRQTGKILDKAM